MRRLLFALPLLAAPAAAQPSPPDSTLPELSVVATRTAVTPAEAPSRVVILDAGDVRAAGASTVADLLESRAPVQVRRYGPGGAATLSIRGGGAGHTALLLDGHPLTDPQLGLVDFALLPSPLLWRLELVHGAGSALHGAGALGGVVALTTPTAPATPMASIESRAGAWGERAVEGLAALRAGRVGVVLAALGESAQDDYPYFDPNAGVEGGVVRRAGADRVLGSLYARVASTGPVPATVAMWAGSSERGAPGAAGTAIDQAGRQWDRHVRVWGDVTAPAGAGTVRAGALVQRASLRFAGPAGDDTGRTWLASANGELSAGLSSAWTAASGVEVAVASADHPSLASDAREGRFSGWTAGTARTGRWMLYPAIRADTYFRRGAGTLAAVSPRLGVNLTVTSALHLKGSAGTAFRAPTFNDRFWRYTDPSTPAGDPGLLPERGWTVDAGVHASRGAVTAEITAYLSNTRDLIVWLPGEEGLYAPENLARTRARGVEATVDLDDVVLGRWRINAGAAYAFTDARDLSSPGSAVYDRPLRYVSRHVASGRVGAATDVGAASAVLEVAARVVGSRPTRADGGAPLPAHGVLDVRLRIARSIRRAGVEAAVALENVADTKYSVVEGYPMPPRHATLSLRLTF